MSSLAATQADGYYVPPEYYDSGQKKTKNQIEGSKGHNQFVQRGVVRFELPYDGFCENCGDHVGKGTRFNAVKTKVGNYFSTPIWEFTMSCRVCAAQTFRIRTNPRERSFDYEQGIHKQVQEFDTDKAGTAGVIDTDSGSHKIVPGHSKMDVAKLNTATTDGVATVSGSLSGLERLEQAASGKRRVLTEAEKFHQMVHVSNQTYGDDVSGNSKIRQTFRKDRKEKKERVVKGGKLGWKRGMELIAKDRLEDVVESKLRVYADGKQAERKRFQSIRQTSIFGTTKGTPNKRYIGTSGSSGRRSTRRERPGRLVHHNASRQAGSDHDDDDDDDDDHDEPVSPDSAISNTSAPVVPDTVVSSSQHATPVRPKKRRILVGPVGVGKKRILMGDEPTANTPSTATPKSTATSSLTALMDYDSDSD